MGAYLSYLVGGAERSLTEHSTPQAASKYKYDPLQDFTTSLDDLVEQHLKAESKDESSRSRLIASLLEVVHTLQGRIDTLGLALKEDKQQIESSTTQETASTPTGYQVLHRVFCDSQDHCHNGVVYEDEPQISNNLGWGVEEVLRGNQPIFNVETYLSQRSGIHFIVFKEYVCGTGQSLHMKPDSGNDNENIQTISERKERLWVITRSLHDALVEVIGADPYNTIALAVNVYEMDAPYTPLFHHQEELHRTAEAHPNLAYKAAVAALVSFIEQHYRAEYDEAQQMFQKGLVSLLHLDKLFKPNDIVVARKADKRSIRAGVLTNYYWYQSGFITLRGWCWGNDGVRLVRVPWISTVWVPPNLDYPDGRPITDLTVYPLQYAPISEQEQLRKRGNKYWNAKNRYYCDYSGFGVHGRQEYISSRFMIDVSTYYQVHGLDEDFSRSFHADDAFALDMSNDSSATLRNDPWPAQISVTQKTIDPDCVLMVPPTIVGFNMSARSWAWLHVDGVADVTWNDSAFEYLVLDLDTKKLIDALVSSQSRSSGGSDFADIVKGKGRGLTVLLHGPPGTGKTLTVESISEYTKRPLYNISPGDVSGDLGSVEKYLSEAMSLAEKWNCILLFDEADVFLEQRSEANLERNAVVSLFLRALEYYAGTLFLTTNRVGTFDEAFRSRINLSIHYQTLNKKARKEIWANMIKLSDRRWARQNINDILDELDDLAKYELNGRQIRNALQTSSRIAEAENRQIHYKDLVQAITQTNSFEGYLRQVGPRHDRWVSASDEGIR